MNYKSFNIYFKFYLIFLLIIGSFYLFQKYNNPVEYTISEWLINYQGGFTRRGLIGEIIHQLEKIVFLSHRELILLFQITTYYLYFFLLFKLFKELKIDFILLLAIFSPLFLSYQFSEIEVLARKEIFAYTFIVITSLLFSSNNIPKYNYILFSIMLFLLVLIWEGIIFFFQYFLFILFAKNGFIISKKRIFNIFLILMPSIITVYLVTFFKLSPSQITLMCNSFNEDCYNAINFLHWPLRSAISEVRTGFKLSYLLRYTLIFLIGFFPLFLLIKRSKILSKKNIFGKHAILIFFIIMTVLTLPIFYIAKDWARWINITYTLSIITFIFCLKNKIINYEKPNLKWYLYKNKFFMIFLIIIFCFSWSPKTLVNDDVSSIPLYRKTVNIFKYFN